ncbi:MAG: alpha/beta fold hydrolase [Thermomicrobiales bacterium]
MTESDRNDLHESTAPTATAEPQPEPERESQPEPQAQAQPEPSRRAADASGPIVAPPEPGPTGLSPDGTTLAYFLHEPDGSLRFRLHPLDGEPRDLPIQLHFEPVEDRDGPQWSPDGTRIAFAGRHDSRAAIFVVEVENGSASLLADHPAPDHTPRWSPDGQLIAFASHRGGRDAICVALADGSGTVIQLTDAFPGQDDREPVWSKTGDRVAFIRRTVEMSGAEPQLADHIWSVALDTGETKQLTKKAAIRHSLRWGPERPLIVHVTEDGEWDQLAVVNADNSAGWTLASEAGDKADPRWSADGSRVVYTRAQNGIVRCCDRATSAASPILLDPGDGVAAYPRWLPDKNVVYAYTAPGQPFRFVVQENKADAERGEIAIVDWQPDRSLVAPSTLDVESAAGNKLGGFLYRQAEISGLTPAVVLLPSRPDATMDARFRGVEQALAAAGLAVHTPIVAGMRGRGRTLAKALHEQSSRGEEEVSDLVDVVAKLRETGGIDAGKVAVAGAGYGATLALLLAGARPGAVQAVVAIDPITDWTVELNHADDAWRAWLTRVYGLPVAQPGKYALRTPNTFVGVIEVPLLLLGTASAPAHRVSQLDELATTLDELGVAYTRDTLSAGSDWETGARIAAFLRDTYLAMPPTPPQPAAEPLAGNDPAPEAASDEPTAATENGVASDAARGDAR